jgi:hypothetical protein
MLFAVDAMLAYSQPDCAFALLQQIVQFCDYLVLEKPKIKVYIKMADVCSKTTEYANAIQILHKAIELCWIFRDSKTEIKLYDIIGYNYYMMGMTNISILNHEKSWQGACEPDESLLKKNVISANLRTKCVELNDKKADLTFENLHVFGFSVDFYNQGKRILRQSRKCSEDVT